MSEQLQLIRQLIDVTPSPRWRKVLDEMYAHMRLPMQNVLSRVPGESISDKVAAIGVSKTTYHEWVRESFRPNQVMAAKLAELTGYSAAAIHGRTEEENANPRNSAAKTPTTVASSRKTASRMHGRARRIRRRVDDAQNRG